MSRRALLEDAFARAGPAVTRGRSVRRRRVAGLVAFVVGALPSAALAHGDLHEQIERVSRRIAARPEVASLYLRRAELHRDHGDWPAALADVQRAAERGAPTAETALLRGLVFADAGSRASALDEFDASIAAAPTAAALTARARVLVALDRTEEAAVDLAEAIERADMARPDLFLELSRLLASPPMERLEEALRCIELGIERLGRLPAFAQEAIVLDRCLGDYSSALKRVDALLQTANRRESGLVLRGDVLREAGRGAEAAAAYREALVAANALPARARRAPMTVELRAAADRALRELEREAARVPAPGSERGGPD